MEKQKHTHLLNKNNMKKINFEKLFIATDIARRHCESKDCREDFANILYRYGNGIASHALALKIYNSNEETEYTDEEVSLIQEHANTFCKPFFIDALNRAINNQPEEATR